MKLKINKPSKSPTEIKNVPQWHIEIVQERLNNYKTNPERILDFDEVMNDIEKGLNIKR